MPSQGDPAWRSLSIGNTTVGKSGCLAFSLMDALTSMGLSFSSPAAFVQMLKENGLFTSAGLLKWNLSMLFPVTVRRLTLAGSAAYDEAKRGLTAGMSVLLQVKTPRGTLHWLVATKAADGDFFVRDPNGGRTGLLSTLYGGISSLRGLAELSPQ